VWRRGVRISTASCMPESCETSQEISEITESEHQVHALTETIISLFQIVLFGGMNFRVV